MSQLAGHVDLDDIGCVFLKTFFMKTILWNHTSIQTYINSQDSCNIPAHNSAPHTASQTKELKQEVEEVSKSP